MRKSSFKKLFMLLNLTLLLLAAIRVCGQQKKFTADFAPSENFIKPMEVPYRDAVCLNGSWSFYPVDVATTAGKNLISAPVYPDNVTWESTRMRIPSPWNVNSFATENMAGGDYVTFPSYPKKWENVKAGWLMRKISYKKEWKNKKLMLRFDAVGGYTQVYINKKKVGENYDVFLPFELDITDELKSSGDNELAVWVADAQLLNKDSRLGRRLYVAGSFWGQHVRGIWQDVNLIALPRTNIGETFINAKVDSGLLNVTAVVSNNTAKTMDVTVTGMITPWINLAQKNVIGAPEPKWKTGEVVLKTSDRRIIIAPGTNKTITFSIKVNDKLNYWNPDRPQLYGLTLSLKNKLEVIDRQYTRFGWRQFKLNGSQFLLNGRPIVLKGDSWHFMGIPQMTRRYAWGWFKALQNAHGNAVRLHAQPYPAFYMDMADEMGVCVLDETGMWASDAGPKIDDDNYWTRSEDHLKRLILRDRNHPSVFGWSVCNENLAVTIGVLHAPDSIIKKQVDEINKWVAITRKLDPSRSWISGDGETNLKTDLPTVIGHYGDEAAWKDWSSQGKVWGIGESGMAYYGTPLQTSAYNGDKSFKSQQGRMEGVAMEATKLLNLQKKYKASYNSIFNIIWYGLQPLELGLSDTTRAPRLTDGIFFKPFEEGKPGIQPERLGPYTTTINPGYDPLLPLYRTWPLYDAIKSAFGDSLQSNVKVSDAITSPKTNTNLPDASLRLLSADPDSALTKIFRAMGVAVNKPADNKNVVLVIDGIYPPNDASAIVQYKSTLKSGGKVLIWGASPSSLTVLNKYLPHPVALTNRKATSFIVKGSDPILAGTDNKDFYFTELSNSPVLDYGLTGSFVSSGHVLLEACRTDWNTWNKQAEYLKTAAVQRSEREKKAAGATLVAATVDDGIVYLLAMDPGVLYRSSLNVIKTMFSNIGIAAKSDYSADRRAIDSTGIVEKALGIASFNIAGKTDDEIRHENFLNNGGKDEYYPGQEINNRTWQQMTAGDGQFDFNKVKFKGQTENAISYLSFWVYSPRSLSNLLLEPDMPRIDLFLKASGGYQVFLNRSLLKDAIMKTEAPNDDLPVVKAIPLDKGWNHFLIKLVHKTGDWKSRIEFKSDKKDFLKNEIKSQIFY